MRRRNRHVVLLGTVALAAMLSVADVYAQSQSPQSYELSWLGVTPGQLLHVDGFELTETFDASTGQRHDYIQAPGEEHPREFYHHGRGIAVALVSQCKMLLGVCREYGITILTLPLEVHRAAPKSEVGNRVTSLVAFASPQDHFSQPMHGLSCCLLKTSARLGLSGTA